ncbi:MAG TPA: hypothetical protein VIL28_14525 [Steroidobacteraceae bacterium]
MNDELKDQLRKLGLRVRPRTTGKPAKGKTPGRIEYDARGNPIYQWSDPSLAEDSERAERARNRALMHHGLAIVEDDPPANAPIRPNPKGLRLGYNPYESGVLGNKPRRKKKDLRELSKWIETQRKLKNKRSED